MARRPSTEPETVAPGLGRSPATSSARPRMYRTAGMLEVEAFRLDLDGHAYELPAPVRIDLAALRPGRYRVLAVQNFHVEDDNPDLDVSVAGVFLAARRGDGLWEAPERFPVECRTLGALGEVTLP